MFHVKHRHRPWHPGRVAQTGNGGNSLTGLFRAADFRRLLTARVLSQLSDGVFQVSLASYVIFSPERQSSPADIASVLLVLLLPFSLIGPFAGVLLDRWRRRQVLYLGNLARCGLGLVTGALLLAGVPDWLFLGAALLVTALNRFILAGLSAALPGWSRVPSNWSPPTRSPPPSAPSPRSAAAASASWST